MYDQASVSDSIDIKTQGARLGKDVVICSRTVCCLAAAVFYLSSCSSPDIRREENVRLIPEVPFHSQPAYQCGPASLAAVLNYYGIDISPEEIAEEIYSRSAKGTLNMDMALYTERMGLRTQEYSSDIEDLKENVDAGHPVIVMVDYGFYIYQRNHFMVVIGYSQNGIIVNSGDNRFKAISYGDFEKTWLKTKRWSLLIYPEERG